MEKKRYAHVGIGGRAIMYYTAIAKDFNEYAELVAFCDINRSRMEYAEYLLVYTDQSVGQIADELGYSSDVQFIQQFNKFTGQTPGKYRNALR